MFWETYIHGSSCHSITKLYSEVQPQPHWLFEPSKWYICDLHNERVVARFGFRLVNVQTKAKRSQIDWYAIRLNVETLFKGKGKFSNELRRVPCSQEFSVEIFIAYECMFSKDIFYAWQNSVAQNILYFAWPLQLIGKTNFRHVDHLCVVRPVHGNCVHVAFF